MLKKHKKILSLLAVTYLVFILSTLTVYSATTGSKMALQTDPTKPLEYIPLEPNAFPGVSTTGSDGDIGTFLGQIFNFGIAAAVVLALLEIIWGGVEYMTTDSWYTKGDGKDRIYNAIIGLGIALISYLLLYTINPDLVDFSKNLLFK